MTKPSTDELIDDLRNLKIEYCDLDTVNAAADRLETLRKAAEGMAEALDDYEEAIRQHIATEFPNSAWVPANLKEAIDKGKSALAAYEATK